VQDNDLYDLDATPAGHRSGFVAVIGRPNVGKSTLMNRFVGQKVAIVSPKPQTTRSRILGILTHEDYQVIFVDTPGLHHPRHKLGQTMVATATHAIPDADVVLFLVDVSVPPTEQDRAIAKLIQEQTHHSYAKGSAAAHSHIKGSAATHSHIKGSTATHSHIKGSAATHSHIKGSTATHSHIKGSTATASVILVLNKMDLLPPDKVQAHTEAYWKAAPSHQEWMMTVATEGKNLDELLELIVAALPEGPCYYPGDQVTDQTEREIGAELIREQVLRHMRQEIPHAVAVVVEEFKERENGVVYVGANVFVEKDSQKGIIIGKQGQMLRQIGSAARREIERMAGGQVYLDLWVKVRKKWRWDERELRRMGYG